MVSAADFRKVDFFAACSPREIDQLTPFCRKAAVRKFHVIHADGAPVQFVYAVLAGEVVLHGASSDEDEPPRLAVVRSGEMFGFGEFMLEHYYTHASALSDAVLLEVRHEDFRSHFMAVASIREQVLLALSKICRYLINKSSGGAANDLALYLLSLSTECGRPEGARIRIQRKLLQPEIASLLNLSREHVTRLFARLKTEGAVDFNGGFPIIDRAWLDRMVRDKDLAASIQYRDADPGASDVHH